MRNLLSLAALSLVAAAFYLVPAEAAQARALLAGAAAACAIDVGIGFFRTGRRRAKESRLMWTSMRALQLGEFLSYVLYQLREYLISVTSLVESLALSPAKDQPGVGEKLERLRKIVGELNAKAGRLLGDQSPVTTQRAGSCAFSITELVERCVSVSQESYGGIVDAAVVREGVVPAVTGDRRALQASLLAVLQNAFDACERSGSGRVTVTLRAADNRAQIEITDDAGGMEAPLDGVFEPLHAARGGADGLGLGLSMGRRLMERAGGSLRLKTKAPCTAVLLEFPLSQDLPIIRNEESTWAGRRDKI